MTTQQVHNFLTTRIGQVLEELTIESGLPISFSSANLNHIATAIEEYMLLEQEPGIVNEFGANEMEVNECE
jgi:hypothetical protein